MKLKKVVGNGRVANLLIKVEDHHVLVALKRFENKNGVTILWPCSGAGDIYDQDDYYLVHRSDGIRDVVGAYIEEVMA